MFYALLSSMEINVCIRERPDWEHSRESAMVARQASVLDGLD